MPESAKQEKEQSFFKTERRVHYIKGKGNRGRPKEYTFIPTSLASPSLRRFYNTKDAIEHLRGTVKKRERDSFEIRPSDTEYKNELGYRIVESPLTY
jgi:hypothetical protein